jgi:hypothetical protein
MPTSLIIGGKRPLFFAWPIRIQIICLVQSADNQRCFSDLYRWHTGQDSFTGSPRHTIHHVNPALTKNKCQLCPANMLTLPEADTRRGVVVGVVELITRHAKGVGMDFAGGLG